jgi:hypothetical protein
MARTSRRARRNSAYHLPGAFDLFTPSKELVLKNIWIFGPLYAVPLIFGIHDWIWSPGPNQPHHWYNHAYGLNASTPGNPIPDYGFSAFVGLTLLWFLIVLIVGSVAAMMSQAAQLDAVEKRPLDFQDLWKVVKELGWRLLGLYVVMAVIIIVGFILLIIPGLFAVRRYMLAPYVMIDKKTGIREALDKSAELSLVNTGALWGVMGVMFLIGLINIIPFVGGLVSFVVGGLYSVAPAMRYQQLNRLNAR